MQNLNNIAGRLLGLITLLSFSPSAAWSQGRPAPVINRPVPVLNRNASPSQSPQTAIARIWHGRTPTAKADAYYRYLNEAGIQKILAIPGNLGAQVLRRTEGDVTEFTVISYWKSLDAIRKFAGTDIEKTHNLPRDPEFLLELEPRVKHFEVLLDDRKP